MGSDHSPNVSRLQPFTLPERLEIDATYQRFVAGDQAKFMEALDVLNGRSQSE